MVLGEVAELVHPLQRVAARTLDEQENGLHLARPHVDHAQLDGWLGLDADSNPAVLKLAHAEGTSQQVGLIIREFGSARKGTLTVPAARP
jgi:hypothetical protein